MLTKSLAGFEFVILGKISMKSFIIEFLYDNGAYLASEPSLKEGFVIIPDHYKKIQKLFSISIVSEEFH